MLDDYPGIKVLLKYLIMRGTGYRVRWRLPPQNNPGWCLTFDDGPLPNTPNILKALDDCQIKATFFLVGERMLANPNIVAEIVAKGHTIGSHGLSHILMGKLSISEFWRQVKDSFNIIKDFTGIQSKIFRPPYGNISFSQTGLLLSKGIDVIFWSHSKPLGNISIIESVPDANFNAPIMVLHDYDDPAMIANANSYFQKYYKYRNI